MVFDLLAWALGDLPTDQLDVVSYKYCRLGLQPGRQLDVQPVERFNIPLTRTMSQDAPLKFCVSGPYSDY